MNVLHLIDSGGLYGAEIMLLNLVEEQVAFGLKSVIASIGEKNIPEKAFETEALRRGLDLIKFRMMPGPNIKGAYKLLNYAQTNHFDLIHSHGYKGNILLGFIPKFIRKIPLVSTLHGYTSTSGLNKMRLYELLDAMSHRFMDAVVLVNKGMLTHPKLKNRHFIKYSIINNGILSNASHPIRPNKRTNTFTIGSIGRFSTEKGYIYLIEALYLLLQKGIDAHLVLIGEGYERERLEKCVRHFHLEDRVQFPGYLENAKHHIPGFDVYAISSLTEGLPITLLETMQARTPVVATAVGGIPDVINDKKEGILVKPCDPAGMAEAFYMLCKDQAYSNELAENAYNKMKSSYSSRRMASEYFTLYSDIINNKRVQV